MGLWSVVIPEACRNKAINPSAGLTGSGYGDVAGGTVTPANTYSFRGAQSYLVETTVAGDGGSWDLEALANAIHYVSYYIRHDPATSEWEVSLDGAAYHLPVLLETHDDWRRYGVEIPAAEASGSTALEIVRADGGAVSVHIDAIQVEERAYPTTYVDGDVPGCEWVGTPHASASVRSGQLRSGGRLYDLEDDFGVYVTHDVGAGLPPIAHNILDRALQPGGHFQSSKAQARTLQLALVASAPDIEDLHAIRADLIDALKPDLVSPEQPIRLRYTGGSIPIEVDGYYDNGLDGGRADALAEQIVGRIICYEPFFHEVGETAHHLTLSRNVANADYIVERRDGQWGALDVGANGIVECVRIGPDGYVYAGGRFTSIGGVAANYIAYWDGNAWHPLEAGASDFVYDIQFGPNGDLYACGSFASMDGVANTMAIARWDGTNWNALAAGLRLAPGVAATARRMAFGPDGTLYVIGAIAADGTGATALLNIAQWDGSAWSAVGGGLNGTGNDIAVDAQGALYAVGAFTAEGGGGASMARVGKFAGSWAALGAGLDATAWAVAVREDGTVVAGGQFTTAGGVAASSIASWNGRSWSPLGAGVSGGTGPGNPNVNRLRFDDNGLLWLAGNFTVAGGLSTTDRLAAWNGSAYVHPDIDLPGTGVVNSIDIRGDRVVLGTAQAGTAVTSYLNAATNPGSRTAYPRLVIGRVGGTSARLLWLKNETTGAMLWLDYNLLDGETLTLDFAPTTVGRGGRVQPGKSITSNYWGNVIGRALLPSSQMSSFGLAPGANQISVFCLVAGAPTMTAYLLYHPTYWSADV